MKDEILYNKLNGNQVNLLRNKIQESLLDSISNGEILFEEWRLSEGYKIKRIKWGVKLTIIE